MQNEALAVGAADAAAMVGLSLRSWWRAVASGKAPRPYKIGRRSIWKVGDLQAWATAGFPSREQHGGDGQCRQP